MASFNLLVTSVTIEVKSKNPFLEWVFDLKAFLLLLK